MTIETKYNVGQRVFFMEQNKVISDTIISIRTLSAISTDTTVLYEFQPSNIKYTKWEWELFANKEELLKSL